MKLSKKDFVEFLVSNPNKTAWTNDNKKCPLALYLNTRGYDAEVYMRHMNIAKRGKALKAIDAPPWVIRFICILDDSYSDSTRIKFSRVLSILKLSEKTP